MSQTPRQIGAIVQFEGIWLAQCSAGWPVIFFMNFAPTDYIGLRTMWLPDYNIVVS